jgi:hypothetical protein
VTTGFWAASLTECGPFKALAKAGKATETVTVTANAFDPTVSASWSNVALGDFMKLAQTAATAAPGTFNPVELGPGDTATIDVTITPTATAGTVVTGTLYLDDYQDMIPPYGIPEASEVAAVPYTYTVG